MIKELEKKKEIEQKKHIKTLRYMYQKYLYDISTSQVIESSELEDYNYTILYQKERNRKKV